MSSRDGHSLLPSPQTLAWPHRGEGTGLLEHGAASADDVALAAATSTRFARPSSVHSINKQDVPAQGAHRRGCLAHVGRKALVILAVLVTLFIATAVSYPFVLHAADSSGTGKEHRAKKNRQRAAAIVTTHAVYITALVVETLLLLVVSLALRRRVRDARRPNDHQGLQMMDRNEAGFQEWPAAAATLDREDIDESVYAPQNRAAPSSVWRASTNRHTVTHGGNVGAGPALGNTAGSGRPGGYLHRRPYDGPDEGDVRPRRESSARQANGPPRVRTHRRPEAAQAAGGLHRASSVGAGRRPPLYAGPVDPSAVTGTGDAEDLEIGSNVLRGTLPVYGEEDGSALLLRANSISSHQSDGTLGREAPNVPPKGRS